MNEKALKWLEDKRTDLADTIEMYDESMDEYAHGGKERKRREQYLTEYRAELKCVEWLIEQIGGGE